MRSILSCSESRYCCGTTGWLPWFLKEVHALARGADPGRTEEELSGFFAEVRDDKAGSAYREESLLISENPLFERVDSQSESSIQ